LAEAKMGVEMLRKLVASLLGSGFGSMVGSCLLGWMTRSADVSGFLVCVRCGVVRGMTRRRRCPGDLIL
jgi:hypothetical protein